MSVCVCVEIILMCSTVSRVKSAEEMVKSKGENLIYYFLFVVCFLDCSESCVPDRG